MSCPKCNSALPDGSAFCNRCGAAVAPGIAPPSPLQPSPASQEPEHELWKGRFSGKSQGHWWFLWFLEMPALVYGWFRLPPDLRQGPYARWAFVAAAVAPVVLIFWKLLVEKLSTRYRLTNYRLFKESGFLSREIIEIELFRVDDVSVRQNLLQRIFNVGVITVIAPHDQIEPRLELVGVENPIEVKEMIRTNVRHRRQGSLNVENL
ncbi:MAG TPA: PH domain-containing protein [Planctomycetota bacterium]|nr:PH domain-containing protein [Planctomycetota bacterium]